MQRLLTILAVFWIICGIEGSSMELEKCDISSWYSRVISEGLFEGPLNVQQRKTHEIIKNILSNGKNKRVECSTLLAFENDLKKSATGRQSTESERTKRKIIQSPIKSKETIENSGKQQTVSKEREDTAQKPDAVTETNNQKTNTDHSPHTTKKTDDIEVYSATVAEENDEKNVPQNVYVLKNKMESHETINTLIFQEKEKDIQMTNDIDETELDDTEEEETIYVDRVEKENVEENALNEHEHNDDFSPEHDTGLNDKTKKEMEIQDSADLGPRNSHVGVSMTDDTRTCEKYTWKYQSQLALKISPAKKFSTRNKFSVVYSCENSFAISPLYCLSKPENWGSIKIIQNETSLTENQGHLEKESSFPFKQSELDTSKKIGSVNLNNSDKEQNEQKEVESVDQSPSEGNLEKLKNDLYKHIEKYVNVDIEHDETYNHQKVKDTIDLDQVKKIVSLKTEEYNEKMRFLELNIIKLENQMLMEKLNKENHSSTIARLENNILRLENELLRMKQSFHHMKIDNDEIRKTQRKYLELGHSPEGSSLQRNNQEEMLLTQQKTISMLLEKLQNQSGEITRIRNRSDYIDEQNRMLHSLIMNQTTLVSQIMGKVQDLTEKSFQQQEITKEMKEQISNGLADVKALKDSKSKSENFEEISDSKHHNIEDLSQQLLQQLDDLVSDKKLETGGNLDSTPHAVETKDNEDEIDEQLKQYLHHTSVFYLVRPDQWCHTILFCYKGIIVSSDCVPFSPITYAKCEVSSELQNSKIGTRKLNTGKHDKIQLGHSLKVTNESDTSKNIQPPDPDDGSQFGKNESLSNMNPEEQNVPAPLDKEEESDVNTSLNKLNIESVEKDIVSGPTKSPNGFDRDADKPKDVITTKSFAQKPTENTVNGNAMDHSESKEERKLSDSGAEDRGKVIETKKSSKEKIEIKETDMKLTIRENNSTANKRLPVRYASNGQSDPKDCYDYFMKGNSRNGVYKIRPYGTNRLVQVYCDMKNGGWTLIQKRQDGTTNFYRDWDDYKEGFGGVYGEHWLGNGVIHRLTNQDHYTLRVELMDWDKNRRFAEYSEFLVDDEDEGFKLHISGYTGDAGDAMNKHNKQKFSTRDVDNDQVVKEFGGSCAKRFHAAWWYYKCYQSNLNGKYYRNGKVDDKRFDGLAWKPWTGTNYSLKHVEMKIRPVFAGV